MTAEVSGERVYNDLCRKFARMLEIAFSSRSRSAMLALVDDAKQQVRELVDDDSVPSHDQYNCVLILALMRFLPAYTAQDVDILGKAMPRLRRAIERASVPQADEVVIKALLHQFEYNEIKEIDDAITNEANPDLWLAIRYIRRMGEQLSVK